MTQAYPRTLGKGPVNHPMDETGEPLVPRLGLAVFLPVNLATTPLASNMVSEIAIPVSLPAERKRREETNSMNTTSDAQTRIQFIRQGLKQVSQSATWLRSAYQACSQETVQTQGDLTAAQPALQTALQDDKKTVVAAEGAIIQKEVKEALWRLRHSQAQLDSLVRKASQVQPSLARADQQFAQLAGELAGQPTSVATLNRCRELVQIASSQHQGAARAAGWARSKALMVERPLVQCGNDIAVIASDEKGMRVDEEAGRVKPCLDQAQALLKEQGGFLQSSQQYQQNSVQCLQEIDWRLAQLLSPKESRWAPMMLRQSLITEGPFQAKAPD